MADEISRTIALNWSKGGASMNLSVNYKTTQIGNAAIENVQTVGAASEAILFGDVSDPGVIGFKNLNPTWASLSAADKVTAISQATYELANTVHIGSINPCVAATAQFHLVPGAGHTFDTNVALWYAIKQASGADVNLLVIAIQR